MGEHKDSINRNNGRYQSLTETDVVLYHGSREGINGNIKPRSRRGTDFGSGFYAGTNEEQALAIIRDNGLRKIFIHWE